MLDSTHREDDLGTLRGEGWQIALGDFFERIPARVWQRHAPRLLCAAALLAGCLALCLQEDAGFGSGDVNEQELLLLQGRVLGPASSSRDECCASHCRGTPSVRKAAPAPQNTTQCSRDVVAGRLCECLVQGASPRGTPRPASEVAAMPLSDVRQHVVTELSSAGVCKWSACSTLPEQTLADLCLPCSQVFTERWFKLCNHEVLDVDVIHLGRGICK